MLNANPNGPKTKLEIMPNVVPEVHHMVSKIYFDNDCSDDAKVSKKVKNIT